MSRFYLESSINDEKESVYVWNVDYRGSLSGVNGTITSGQSSHNELANPSLASVVQLQTTMRVQPSIISTQPKPVTTSMKPPIQSLKSTPIPTMKSPSPTQLEKAFNLIVHGQSDSSNRIIYFTPNQFGGFSNGFRAIRSLALYSILYGYKLRGRIRSLFPCVVDWFQFFEVMNNSMRVLSSTVNKQCSYIPTFNVPFGANGLQVWGCIWTDDIADMTERMTQYPENGRKLMRLGLFDSVPTFGEVAHFTSVLLFRLHTVLHGQADAAFSRFPHPLLGLQVRMGGSSANTHEEVVFCTLDKVDSILSYVDSFVKKNQISNVTLFLSTDSDEMAQAIRRKS